MFNRRSICGRPRARAMVAAILGTGALIAYLPLVSAEEAKSDDTVLDEVQVTGSRIKHTTDYTTAVPTTVIDVKTMEDAGVVNVGDVLALTPSNISAFTPTTTGGSSFNTGAYVPDLRGLNPFFGSRTLTLIDTQRPVSTSTLDSFDLNMIPSALVQRIDSVTGGGSASYGSGAVAGAINIILNHQLEGGKFDIDHYAAIPENDAKSDHLALAYGHGLFDNRFHFVLGGEYQKSGAASCMESAREWCARSYGPYQTSTVLASASRHVDDGDPERRGRPDQQRQCQRRIRAFGLQWRAPSSTNTTTTGFASSTAGWHGDATLPRQLEHLPEQCTRR
ncbi:MAG: TonB-dependent receptor plug domain-containing protein [Pseudomonadota bacterium]